MNTGKVTLKDLHTAELYLMNGYAYYSAGRIPKAYKDRYIKEIGLEYVGARHTYKGDYEKIWDYFHKLYADKLNQMKIRSYDQLQYEVARHIV